MSNHSFVIEQQLAATAQVGQLLLVEGTEAHHAVTVKRVKPGEELDLLDGAGTRLVVQVHSCDKQSLQVLVQHISVEQPVRHPVQLIQALAKGDRDLQAVEAAVELGISAVRPWQAERSIVRWNEAKTEKALAKWRAQVRSAQKQSRRSFEPAVLAPVTTKQLATTVGELCSAGDLVLVLHEAALKPMTEHVGNWLDSAPEAAGVALVVGPEGGISDTEIAALQEAGGVPVVLGSHVLRASTAGPAALVLVRHLLGQV